MDAQIQQHIAHLKQDCTELRLQRHLNQAIVVAQQVLELMRQQLADDHPDVTEGLKLLAELYEASGDQESSHKLLQKAGEQHQAIPSDQVSIAHKLQSEAMQLYEEGNYTAAIPLQKQAVYLFQQSLGGENSDVATGLNNLAVLYKAQGNYVEAEPLYVCSLAMREKELGTEHPDVATSLSNLASLYKDQGHYVKAELLYKRSLAIWEGPLDSAHPDAVACLSNLATLYLTQGRYVEAEPLYKRSLVIWTERFGPEHSTVATSLNNLALLYKHQGRHVEAESYCVRSLVIRKKVLGAEHPAVATSLNNLAGIYRDKGEYWQAEPLYVLSLTIREKALGSEHPDVAASLSNLAGIYKTQGQYIEAERLYLRSLSIQEKVLGTKHPDVANSLSNLAGIYKTQGRYAEAEIFCARALAIWEERLGPEHSTVAFSLNNLASLYDAQGYYTEAEPLYLRSLSIQEKVLGPQHPAVATTFNNLAMIYQSQDRYKEAESLLVRSRSIWESQFGSEHPHVATSLSNLATLYKNQGRYMEAEPLYLRSLSIREKAFGQEHPENANSLNNLAGLFAATGRREEAFALMKRSAAIENTLIGQISSAASENQRMDFLATLKPRFYGFLSLASKLVQYHPETVLVALDMTLRRKAIAAEALAVQQELILGGRYPHLKEQLNKLISLRRQIAQETLVGPGTQNYASYKQNVDQANREKERLQADLARQIPEMNLQQKLQDANRKAIALSLPLDAALIEFVHYNTYDFEAIPAHGDVRWQPARYLAFVLSARQPENARMVDLGEAAPIDRIIAGFRDAILRAADKDDRSTWASEDAETTRDGAAKEAGDILRQALFAPLLSELNDCKHLLLALDGDLTRLPFEALPSNDSAQYLGEKYRFSYLSVGRDALRFDAETSIKPSQSVICANPNYTLSESKENDSPAATMTLTLQIGQSRQSRDFDRENLSFGPLPASEIEGQRIAALLDVTPWLTDDVLEKPLKVCSSPYILHISTHGYFQEDQNVPRENRDRIPGGQSGSGMENPLLRSGLALAGAETFLRGGQLPVAAEDGLLTAEDVTGMDLIATEMVVLSACETGLGDIQTGEGVMGLRRAFMLAGAKTLVMSLWKVDDTATALLMDRFYRNLLEESMERDIALHEAQRYVRMLTIKQVRQEAGWLSGGDNGRRTKLLHRFNLRDYKGTDCPFAAPYYWAAFICQGVTRPLPPFTALNT